MLQLASLKKRCQEKENEINELRRRIIEKLEDEEQEKQDKQEEHERETSMKKEKNLAVRQQLVEILTTLREGGEEDD